MPTVQPAGIVLPEPTREWMPGSMRCETSLTSVFSDGLHYVRPRRPRIL